MIVGIPVALGPAVVLAVRVLASLVAAIVVRPVASLARVIGLLAIAIALGLSVRLWILGQNRPVDLDVFGPSATPDATKPDLVVATIVTTALILGLVALAAISDDSTPQRPLGPPVVLLAVLLVCLLALDLDLTTSVLLWTLVALVGAGWQIVRSPGSADRSRTILDGIRSWLTLAFVGAPVLWVASALAMGSAAPTMQSAGPVPVRPAVGALLIVAGAASAGLAPLGGWLRSVAKDDGSAVIGDGLLPLVGLALAVRALGLGGTALPASLAGLLVFLGLCGSAEAVWSSWRADEHGGLLRALGRADVGLAFLALAAGTGFALAAAAFVIGTGVVTRAVARSSPGRWPGRLAWGSLVGLPSLPGFVGRWLLLAAIFAADRPLLALSAGLASVSLGVALLRATTTWVLSRPTDEVRDARGTWNVGAVVATVLLVAAGLTPSQWLLAGLATATGGPLGPPGWTGLLVPPATLIALLPLLVVTPFLNRERPRRRSDALERVERRLWGAGQRLTGQIAALARADDARYDLAAGLLVAISILFAFGS